MNQKKVYFVTMDHCDELAVIRKLKPSRLLCSYFFFKNKPMETFCESIGYKPEILLDSGAYSAHTRNKRVNLLDYMDYVRNNEEYIKHYVSLDVIGDSYLTKAFYSIMRDKGLHPIPVFHYGESLDVLSFYLDRGEKYIALGGTVPVRDKAVVLQWCNYLSALHPDVKFHLLGSTSQKIMDCENIVSCDASTWCIRAAMGHPETIPGKSKEAKRARAEANMTEIMGVFNACTVSDNNNGG